MGIRVQLSNNHTYRDHKGRLRTLVDICDDLKGDYPKDFQFTSWHPHCRCIATPILKTREEMKRDRQLIREGKAPAPSKNEVKELPQNFKTWQEKNAKRIAKATEQGKLPHWYRDNQKLIEGDKLTKKTVQQRAKERHEARTPEQIERIKAKWEDRNKWKDTLASIHERNKILKEEQKSARTEARKKKFEEIKYNEVKKLNKKLRQRTIIARVSGGDLTDGSCVSAALAYIGNKHGLNVKDFRGGNSCDFFSLSGNIRRIVQNLEGEIYRDYDGFKSAEKILKGVEKGKQYFFSTGSHAAIVRRNSTTDALEFLELQSEFKSENKFKPLDKKVLKKRFGVQKSWTRYKMKLEQESTLIDIDKFKGSEEFARVLGYINTESSKQMKGTKGGIK